MSCSGAWKTGVGHWLGPQLRYTWASPRGYLGNLTAQQLASKVSDPKNKTEVVRPFGLQKSHITTSILFYWSLRASSDSVREANNTRTVGSLGDIFTSVQFSCSVVSDSLQPHGPQHDRPPCPSPTPRVYPNSCPLSQWCHPTISSSVIPFSSCPQSFPASGSLQMSQLFISGGQSIGVSASKSMLPMNTQDWSPLGWTGWISLQSKRL